MVGNKFVNIGEIDALELITLDDTLKALVRRGKLWAFNTLFGDQWWADLFGVIQKADYSKSVTVSPSGIIQVIKEYMQRANDISGAVGEEMGSEGIMEMLSEGLSSALETNFNGSLQYILNVWKGSFRLICHMLCQLDRDLTELITCMHCHRLHQLDTHLKQYLKHLLVVQIQD